MQRPSHIELSSSNRTATRASPGLALPMFIGPWWHWFPIGTTSDMAILEQSQQMGQRQSDRNRLRRSVVAFIGCTKATQIGSWCLLLFASPNTESQRFRIDITRKHKWKIISHIFLFAFLQMTKTSHTHRKRSPTLPHLSDRRQRKEEKRGRKMRGTAI